MLGGVAFVMFSIGLLGPVAPVAALARHGPHAGSASALLGTLQFLLGAAAAFLVGAIDDGTARPMAVLIVFASVAVKIADRLRPRGTAAAR